MPGGLFIWYSADALDDEKRRHKHICADVSMLDEIPDRERQAQEAYAVVAARHQLDSFVRSDKTTIDRSGCALLII